MVLRKSHFVSICLMALASAIAITEYATYVPVILPDGIEDDTLTDENSGASDETDGSDSDASEKVDDMVLADETVQEATSSETSAQVDPFSPSGEKEIVLNSGDTLATVIGKLGFDKTDIYLASKSLSKVFNLKTLKVGQKLIVKGTRDSAGDLTLTGIEIRPNYHEKIVVSKNDTGYNAEKLEVPVKKVIRSISGSISPKSPLYSLKKCGMKTNIATDALRGLSQIVNIKSSKTPVDFEFLYQEYYDNEGHVVRKPELLYASVFAGGKIKRIYKFTYGCWSEFVDNNGTIVSSLSKTKSMLDKPVGLMKVTSKFGIRRHPITGQIRAHNGIDISAPVGTPVKAAADGVITKAMYYSGYGRYVRISHYGKVETAYAHLSRIVVRRGQHVKKGQIIAYSGNSGQTTAAHVHYEVHMRGKPINPLGFVAQEPQRLTGDRLYKFNQFKRKINLQIVGLTVNKHKVVKSYRY